MKDILGKNAADKVSNFNGVITGYAEYQMGQSEVLISPIVEVNKGVKSEWIPEERVIFIGGEKVCVGFAETFNNSWLGKKARDKVTCFTGTINSVAYYLGESSRCQLVAESVDNKPAESLWIGVNRAELI